VELFVQAKSSPPEASRAGSEKRNIKKTKLKEKKVTCRRQGAPARAEENVR
jgi:hypothetical protein